MPQVDKVGKFIDAIMHEADARRAEIERATQKHIDKEIQKAEKAAKAESEALVQRRASTIKQDIGRDLSHRQMEMRMALFKRREEIMTEIFSEAKKRLEAFQSSENYEAFLCRSAKKAAEILSGDNITIRVCEADMKYREAIEKAFGKKCEFMADNTISVGGLKFENAEQTLAVDDTLDTRLLSEESWFESQSGLIIA